MAELRLDSPLQYVKGVGPRKAEVLAAHGLHTVRDILWYLPRHYLDRTSVVPIAKAALDQPVTIIGRVRAHGVLHGRRKRYEVILEDDSGAMALVWFGGIRFWERMFKRDMIFAATGTPTYFMGRQMIHPDLERLDPDSDKMIHAGRIIPVYPQTTELSKVGLSSKGIRAVTSSVMENLKGRIPDPIPRSSVSDCTLLDLDTALRQIHYPESQDQVEHSRRRLAFDELLHYEFLVVGSRHQRSSVSKVHHYRAPGARLTDFKKRLPFEFTSGQRRAIREIFDDLGQSRPMSRLLQGDVGCGKTVVALAAALYVAENDLQVAFMAPTEILSEQHFRNWSGIIRELGFSCDLLTSSLKSAEKRAVSEKCKEGEILILFGTHALIYDYVQFDRLGLVIIDEQHRFGVHQRSELHAKGDNPDLLAMTATPIPRTLALTLYGDLDISTIDTLPPGRKPVRTLWRSEDVRDKVYEFVRQEVAQGGQAYFIYPVIEKSEQSALESLEEAYRQLSGGPLSGLSVGMVHGRIKAPERERVISGFRERRINVLMATSVVEVGMDNPNATVMVIEHAERFGLSQLHQLRGRIGRGERQATLIAVAHPPLSDLARQRLEYFVSTTDGFQIAEADLKLRGPGELFGLRQSGIPQFRVARLAQDIDLIEPARRLLERLFAQQGHLDAEHQALLNYVSARVEHDRLALKGA